MTDTLTLTENSKTQSDNTKTNFDYSTNAGQFRTVSWSDYSHQTDVVKPVALSYAKFMTKEKHRDYNPCTACALLSSIIYKGVCKKYICYSPDEWCANN